MTMRPDLATNSPSNVSLSIRAYRRPTGNRTSPPGQRNAPVASSHVVPSGNDGPDVQAHASKNNPGTKRFATHALYPLS